MTIVIFICLAVIGTWVWVEGPKRAARKALAPLAAVAATVLVLIASWHVIEPRLVHLADQTKAAVTPDVPDVGGWLDDRLPPSVTDIPLLDVHSDGHPDRP